MAKVLPLFIFLILSAIIVKEYKLGRLKKPWYQWILICLLLGMPSLAFLLISKWHDNSVVFVLACFIWFLCYPLGVHIFSSDYLGENKLIAKKNKDRNRDTFCKRLLKYSGEVLAALVVGSWISFLSFQVFLRSPNFIFVLGGIEDNIQEPFIILASICKFHIPTTFIVVSILGFSASNNVSRGFLTGAFGAILLCYFVVNKIGIFSFYSAIFIILSIIAGVLGDKFALLLKRRVFHGIYSDS